MNATHPLDPLVNFLASIQWGRDLVAIRGREIHRVSHLGRFWFLIKAHASQQKPFANCKAVKVAYFIISFLRDFQSLLNEKQSLQIEKNLLNLINRIKKESERLKIAKYYEVYKSKRSLLSDLPEDMIESICLFGSPETACALGQSNYRLAKKVQNLSLYWKKQVLAHFHFDQAGKPEEIYQFYEKNWKKTYTALLSNPVKGLQKNFIKKFSCANYLLRDFFKDETFHVLHSYSSLFKLEDPSQTSKLSILNTNAQQALYHNHKLFLLQWKPLYENQICVLDVMTKSLLYSLDCPTNERFALMTVGNRYLVGITNKGKIYFWNPSNGDLIKTWNIGYDHIKILLSTDESLLITKDTGRRLNIWDIEKEELLLPSLSKATFPVNKAVISQILTRDNCLIIGIEGTFHAYSLKPFKAIGQFSLKDFFSACQYIELFQNEVVFVSHTHPVHLIIWNLETKTIEEFMFRLSEQRSMDMKEKYQLIGHHLFCFYYNRQIEQSFLKVACWDLKQKKLVGQQEMKVPELLDFSIKYINGEFILIANGSLSIPYYQSAVYVGTYMKKKLSS
jgi:WD40 repeat protein